MSAITVIDERLEPVVRGAEVVRLCTGAQWGEGPVWMHEDESLLWSDIPNNRMLRWSPVDGMTVWRKNADHANGHTRDHNGDLLHCSHGRRAILRTRCDVAGVDPLAPDEVVVDQYQGKRLNSPNDVVVRRDGTLWFTDPPYGILSDLEGRRAKQEQVANHVFCYDPATRTLHAATTTVEEPNGLAFSLDEKVLFVSDTSAALKPGGNHRIVAFDVDGFTLSGMRIVADVQSGLPDGFRLDRQGWIYTSCETGVQIWLPDGTFLGQIAIPEKVGNLTFGGPRRDQLFVVASTSLYRVHLNTQGIQAP